MGGQAGSLPLFQPGFGQSTQSVSFMLRLEQAGTALESYLHFQRTYDFSGTVSGCHMLPSVAEKYPTRAFRQHLNCWTTLVNGKSWTLGRAIRQEEFVCHLIAVDPSSAVIANSAPSSALFEPRDAGS
jgi:hypothetical protein